MRLLPLGDAVRRRGPAARYPDPSEAAIRSAIGGNLCRCTGYENIVRAAQSAATVAMELERTRRPNPNSASVSTAESARLGSDAP